MTPLIDRLKTLKLDHDRCLSHWSKLGEAAKIEAHKQASATLEEAIASLSPKKPKKAAPRGDKEAIPKDLVTVQYYAGEIALPQKEAERFFDHFSSNGWKVSGKSPMKDWQAALRNWRKSWEERNPTQARLRTSAEAPRSAHPAGWEDWLLSKNMPVTDYATARGWMRDEFAAWMKGAQ